MLIHYESRESCLIPCDADLKNIVWIDAVEPDAAEMETLSAITGFTVPNEQAMSQLEVSSKFYKNGDWYVMIAMLLPDPADTNVTPCPVAFIIDETRLITIRHCAVSTFEQMSGELLGTGKTDPLTILAELLEAAVGGRADDLENSMHRLEKLMMRMFLGGSDWHSTKRAPPDHPELDDALKTIAATGEQMANIRESIASLQRVVTFMRAHFPDSWQKKIQSSTQSMRSDLQALSDETTFMLSKLSFNLDAILGMINIEETKVIRLLSIVTLLLSPPTLIAGIYGMNFNHMPELSWQNGYYFALGLMASTAVASLWYLKHKKWF